MTKQEEIKHLKQEKTVLLPEALADCPIHEYMKAEEKTLTKMLALGEK